MRALLIPPALLVLMACGSSKLSRTEAERDLRVDYPVIIPVRIPARPEAEKGSPAHVKLAALHAAARAFPWIQTGRQENGPREAFTFTLGPGAPKDAKTGPQGIELPAAQAEFAGARRMVPQGRDRAEVVYQIRLAQPTAYFPLWQALHPGIPAGATKDRRAEYRREGRSWVLQKTNEAFAKSPKGGVFGLFD